MSDEARVFPTTGRTDEPGAILVKSPNGSERWYTSATYSITAAGALLGLGRSASFKRVKAGTVPTVNVNGGARGHRVTASALDRLLNPTEYPPEPVEAAAEPEESEEVPSHSDAPVKADDDDCEWHTVRSTGSTLLSYDPPKPPPPADPDRLPTAPWGRDGLARLEPEAFPTPATADDLDDPEHGGRTLPSGVWVGSPIHY